MIPDPCIPVATHSTNMTKRIMDEEVVEQISNQTPEKHVTFKENETIIPIKEPMRQQHQTGVSNEVQETETAISQPRRSTRTRVQPKRYTDSM